MGKLRKLFREPSTYAGAAIVSIAAGQIAGPEAMAVAMGSPWLALLAGLVAVLKLDPADR